MGSEQTHSKATPGGKERIDSSIGSLPSEDLSVKDSVRSVDWKIELPLESDRSALQERENSVIEQKQTSMIREERAEDTDDEE
jgi:hypothetical protein